MAGNKTQSNPHTDVADFDMAERQAKLAKLYRRGMLRVDMAKELGVSKSTITSDILAMIRRWQQSATIDIAERKGRLLEDLELVRIEAFQGLDASKRDKRRTRTAKRTGQGEGLTAETTVETAEGGNPAFLTIILKTWEQEARVLGLDQVIERADGASRRHLMRWLIEKIMTAEERESMWALYNKVNKAELEWRGERGLLTADGQLPPGEEPVVQVEVLNTQTEGDDDEPNGRRTVP